MVNKAKCFEEALQQVRNHRHISLEQADALRQDLLNRHADLKKMEQDLISLIKRQMIAKISSDSLASDLQKEYDALHRQRSAALTELGYAPDVFEPTFNCQICQDNGMLDNGYCDCVKKIAYQKMLEQLNNDLPIDDFNFDSFSLTYYDDLNDRRQMEEVFAFCKQYAKEFSLNSENLYLMGSTGLGKTHLTFSIAKEAVAKGYSVIYCTAQSMISDLEKEHFNHDTISIGENYRNSQLLIIDDLGTEFLSPVAQSVLYNIINTRVLKHLPTIINSNLTATQIEERYGQRLISRIFGCYKTLKFAGKDIRIQKMLISKKV